MWSESTRKGPRDGEEEAAEEIRHTAEDSQAEGESQTKSESQAEGFTCKVHSGNRKAERRRAVSCRWPGHRRRLPAPCAIGGATRRCAFRSEARFLRWRG